MENFSKISLLRFFLDRSSIKVSTFTDRNGIYLETQWNLFDLYFFLFSSSYNTNPLIISFYTCLRPLNEEKKKKEETLLRSINVLVITADHVIRVIIRLLST